MSALLFFLPLKIAECSVAILRRNTLAFLQLFDHVRRRTWSSQTKNMLNSEMAPNSKKKKCSHTHQSFGRTMACFGNSNDEPISTPAAASSVHNSQTTTCFMNAGEFVWLGLFASLVVIFVMFGPRPAALASTIPTSTELSSDLISTNSVLIPQAEPDPVTQLPTPTPVERTGEEATRAALTRIFGVPFVKIRPPFLVNPETKRRLELDCYSEQLRLGVEYSGLQHFVFPNPFHRTQAEFDAQQRRDRYKAQQCQLAGVHLVVVPFTVAKARIESYLRQQLHNFEKGAQYQKKDISLDTVCFQNVIAYPYQR
jgi:hypothetical protein